MKKIFLSLSAIALLAVGTVSCGSDDGGSAPGPGPEPETGLTLTLTTPADQVIAGQGFQMSIVGENSATITGAVLVVNGEPSTITSNNGVFSVQAPAGEYQLYATYEGGQSNTITVVVNPGTPVVSEGEGTFVFNGQTYNTSESYVAFLGLYLESEGSTTVIAAWQIESPSEGKTAIVGFNTPATPSATQEGFYDFELPSATNTTGTYAVVLNGQTAEAEVNSGVQVDFQATMADGSNVFEGVYSSEATLNASPFTLQFDGISPYVDASENQSSKGVNLGFKAALGSPLKATNKVLK